MPVLGVDRVEVIPGVTSALYGPTALSGSVNVVSAPADVSVPSGRERHDARGVGRRGVSDVHVFAGMGRDAPRRPTLSEPGRSRRRRLGRGAGLQAGRRSAARVLVAVSDERLVHDRRLDEARIAGAERSPTSDCPDFNRYSDDADTRRGYAGTVGQVQLDTNTLLTVRASMTREWRTRWYGDNRETRPPQRGLRRRCRHEDTRRERPDRRRRHRPGPVLGARRAWAELPLHDAGALRRAHVDARSAVRHHVERASRPPERVR